MKSILLSLFLAVSAFASDIQVYFSPKGGCTEAVVANLNWQAHLQHSDVYQGDAN